MNTFKTWTYQFVPVFANCYFLRTKLRDVDVARSFNVFTCFVIFHLYHHHVNRCGECKNYWQNISRGFCHRMFYDRCKVPILYDFLKSIKDDCCWRGMRMGRNLWQSAKRIEGSGIKGKLILIMCESIKLRPAKKKHCNGERCAKFKQKFSRFFRANAQWFLLRSSLGREKL